MGALIIALVIMGILSIFIRGVRAYLSFTLLVTGFSMTVVGIVGKESVFFWLGLVCMAVSILMAFLSSLKVEMTKRPRYMFRFIMYGFFIFFMIIFFTMVITIPLGIFFKSMMTNYKEMLVVDEYGTVKGKVYVDEHLRGTDGTQYNYHDPY